MIYTINLIPALTIWAMTMTTVFISVTFTWLIAHPKQN